MKRLLLIAEIDADSDDEAQELLDNYRRAISHQPQSQNVTIYRAQMRDIQDQDLNLVYGETPHSPINLPDK